MVEVWFEQFEYVIIFGFYLGSFVEKVCFLSFLVYLGVI
jgi:hypothetical protein